MSTAFIIGGVIFATAVAIGGLASFRNIREARGPKERSYVLRACAISWSIILSMLVSAYLLHPPWLYLVMAAYFVVTPVLFFRWATTHQLIREVERREAEAEKQSPT
jgi:Ca2+/Na+ antiporter